MRLHSTPPRSRQADVRGDAEECKRRLKRVGATLWRVERERLQPKLHQMKRNGVHHRAGQQCRCRAGENSYGDAKRANDLEA